MAKFLYQYHEERGQFNAYVSDKDGNTVWEVNYPDYYEDELTGEMLEGSTIFEDGFMRHVDDIQGLEKYLKQMGVLKSDDELVDDEDDMDEEEDDEFSKGGITNKYKRYDFNEDGELEANIDGKKHVIKYRGDKSQMYDLYVNGKKFKSNKSVRELMKYADGGEIADEIKSKLTKAAAASENGMALPYEIAVYVPSTQDANKIVNRKEFQRRIDEVQKYLAELFGGFSANDVDGGYTSTDKQVIQEDIYRVVSFATKEAAKTKFPELIEQLSIWAGKWGQEAIGLEFEGDMFYVDKKTKLKRGGYFDKGGKLSNLSADEKEFIAKEKKERDGFTYRAKILFGSPVVLKEKNGTPVKKFAVDELQTANIIAEELNKYQDGGTLGAGSFANGGEIKFEIINELDSDDVDDFFDGDTKEIRSWSEGKGRGQTNYTIYTDGKKYLLDIEDFGFDDFKHNYYIIKIKDGDYEQGGTIGAGSFADGGVTKRKSGNEPKVQRKVDELNRLIKLANENDVEITDNTSTWEAPMRYKPVKYSNGILYFEWDELDLYKANKGLGRVYKHKKDKVLKRSMEFDGIPSLNFLARRYRNALKNAGIQF